MNKIWQIEGKSSENLYSDQELISMISEGLLNGENVISNIYLSEKVKIKDTIYAFYLKGDLK